jgi:apolipoprotein D and lipocalin family protein
MKDNTLLPSRSDRLRTLGSAMLLAALMALGACSTAPPDGITAVTPFDVNRYAGKWYEIARMDHSFERGLSEVSATYRLQPDGSVQVINRGFDSERKDWKEAVGKALFTGDTNRGALKVSFFGPFYGGYNVAAMDPSYRWSLVVGPDRGYVWILSRDRQLTPEVREQVLVQARKLGIDVDRLIWVPQTRPDA